MADQQPPTEPSTTPKTDVPATQSQVPFPNLVPGGGAFSPTTEKQVSDLLAEMQQYATTAAPGTTTTMQFSYQKSKHTTEKTGEEPQVVESKHVEKSVHQSPPPEQKSQGQVEQAQAPASTGATSIFSQIPQFLQEKLGFGGGAPAASQGEGHTEISYQHTKKTTTTTTTSTAGGDQQVVTTQHHGAPQPSPAEQQTPVHEPPPQPHQQPVEQPQGGFFAPLKQAAEKAGEQIGHIPQLLQETFGHPAAETDVQHGEKHVEISYQHSKKTTTTSSSSTTSGDQQQVVAHHEHSTQQPPAQGEPSLIAPLKATAEKAIAGFEHLTEQAVKALTGDRSSPAPGNVQIEVSKHASRQVLTQSGEQAPNIETTSSGYTQVVHGIFNGVPVVGGVVPVIVPVSIQKTGIESSHEALSRTHETHSTFAPPPPQPAVPQPSAPQASGTTTTASTDTTSQLEEQLKKLGLTAGHPVSELLQQTLAQHQRAKTPESNIEIQYSTQRTHSSRTVTYETSGSDTKTAQEALQQLQSSLNTVTTPSQSAPEPPADNAGQNPPPTQG